MEYTFTTDNFETEVLGSDVPVLLISGLPGACRAVCLPP